MANVRKKDQRVTVSLTADEHVQVTALAEREDVSLSWVIRRAVNDYLLRNANGLQTQLPLEE